MIKNINPALSNEIVLLDLFSGTGGFAKGLLNAGFSLKKHYFSEIDKFSAANYQNNFKHAKNLGNIIQVKGSHIERPNIITFGSPCQDISIAGKRKGLKGKRSGLFFEAARLISECRPDVFIFENVKGLFSSNQGKDFEVVLQTLADIGLYDCQWQLLNTSWFLPQNRERVYIVGSLREKAPPKIFPIGESTKGDQPLYQKTPQGKAISPTIDTKVGESTHRSPYVLQWKGSTAKWNCKQVKTSPALHTQTDWMRNPLIVNRNKGAGEFFNVPEATQKGYCTATEGDSINLAFLGPNRKRGRVGKGIAHTLDTGVCQYTLKHGNLRRLTPVECERLQGFPDSWTQLGLFDYEIKEISDAQRYKMLGNAVSVPVVEEIARRLLGNEVNQKNSKVINFKALAHALELLHFKRQAA